MIRPTVVTTEDRIWKRDHPRAIDRYIDFFGSPVAVAASAWPDVSSWTECPSVEVYSGSCWPRLQLLR